MDFVFLRSKKHGREDYGSVYARVRTKGENKKYTTGFIINEQEWANYRSMQFVSSDLMSSIGISYGQFAIILAQIKAALEEDFTPRNATNTILSIKAGVINGRVQEVMVPVVNDSVSFDSYMEMYISDLQSGRRTKRGRTKKVSSGYVMGLKAALNIIKKYEKERRKKLSLDDITMDFQKDFIKWYADKSVCNNTIRQKFNALRTVMIAAYDDKMTKNLDCRHSDFVPLVEDVDHVYLTPEMIQEMLDLDLSSKESVKRLIAASDIKQKKKESMILLLRSSTCKALEISRDVFIVGCLTGQRVSDYSRFSSDMITELEGKRFIRIVQNKTEKQVYIPMDTRVMDLLNKYDGTLPTVNYKKIIRHIKFIGELLHWTYKADIDPSLLGGKKSSRFCDLLGTHTARRSFATNAYAAGVPLSSIMAVTGHSTEQVLRKYLRLQSKEKAIIAARDFAGVIKTE